MRHYVYSRKSFLEESAEKEQRGASFPQIGQKQPSRRSRGRLVRSSAKQREAARSIAKQRQIGQKQRGAFLGAFLGAEKEKRSEAASRSGVE